MNISTRRARGQAVGRVVRVAWTVALIALVQTVVCGLSALPVALFWTWFLPQLAAGSLASAVAVGLLAIPSYTAFALCLLVVSPLASRATGARTPPDAEMRIADLSWPLLAWVRAMVGNHLARLLAGSLFRGSPVWNTYLRLSGARVGRRVFVNTLWTSDHQLLDFGDDVVIGADAHLSGHTVEHGVVKTGRVRLGNGVTIGLASHIDIDVEAGAGCQVGALSVVPKHSRLEAGAVYAGIPAVRIR